MTKCDPQTGPSRRGVIKAAALAGSAACLGGANAAWAGQGAPFDMVIYDERYTDAVAFSREMAARGAPLRPISGDVTHLWYETLDPEWKQAPTLIAGLTETSALTSLELMAQAAGMRVAFRTDLRHDRDGGLARRVEAPAAVAQMAAGLPLDGAWGTQAARLAFACPRVWTPAVQVRAACVSSSRQARDSVGLTAWVLAPVVRS